MKAPHLAIILSLLSVCVVNANADANSDAISKLREIPPATKSDQAIALVPIPCLVLTARGAFIMPSNGLGLYWIPIAFDQVLSALAGLPKSAWHNGRVIAFYSSAPGKSLESPPPISAAHKVEEDLKKADVRFIQPESR